MKLRIALSVLLLAVVALLLNELLVTRAHRQAEPFAGGHVLALDGPDLNVREYGPPGERAVVLLHGYSASIEWWERVAPQLARDQRVIAIDLVGHGGSEAPIEAADYQADGQASAVHNALVALGVRDAVLVGHSMGGEVAAALAQRYPDLVERVVVSDTPAAEELVSMPLLGKMVCWPVIGPALDWFRGVDAITEGSLQSGFAADYPVPEYAHRSLERLTYSGVCDSKDGAPPVVETLAALHKPVLVLWGEQDVLTPTAPNVERYTAAGLPPVVIKGSGHSPMVEQPDQFLAAVTDFVRNPAPAR
ncbi:MULTISPECIES: alpha/beta fold hydrolase [unclassified Mycolicibacterium]|uniref:alpha/beta fold hydrolase n=1 Tax=unclassified Mycolicibacterium TaxID=2636767 RepID=UPI0012DD6471|nr:MULTISPECIES: alpha/beta hydrolase [unclassified Mycolicibacterium]MUL82813.1 alpha/beta hydrolase [Mycolicibacterium sp. CBMA 329]MUL89148.1 alpha/beta hydrolase [Mycolicibacterium sp. CBMA 331]MUL97715.1 alpha/beta hydrolase [Mycolicibacterium sp. CBMA 334]MUM29753.1 alpha/beta hydrolase [Mycolicibacterium sp. CBMA 295]MUM38664.1 alpha/beta hydrolase [Mycolicibacterium sp. CBMA 247]